MSFAHVHARGWGYGSDRSKRQLSELRSIGVTWISISPFAYQRRVDEPVLYFGPGDPTLLDRDVAAVTADAHALGLKVLLKPHIWSHEFWTGGKWHGDIAMKTDEDRVEWWNNYTKYILHNAELATRAQADALCVGLEYVQMTTPPHTPRWRTLIAEVRARFSGPLTYGAHHSREVEEIEFWDALDAIGVHAYYPLGRTHETASAEDVRRAWLPHLASLRALSERFDKPIVFTEIGYPAHRGALEEPWRSVSELPIDEELQARAYEGTLRALSEAPFIRGVFFWKWFSGGRENPHEHDPYDPSGRAAERIIRRWFAQ